MQARQLITDIVRFCGDGEDDNGEDEAGRGEGRNDDHSANDWRELKTLAESNEYTFSKQGASVSKASEFKLSALKLAVIEGKHHQRVFRVVLDDLFCTVFLSSSH